jgi:hypothetical protein
MKAPRVELEVPERTVIHLEPQQRTWHHDRPSTMMVLGVRTDLLSPSSTSGRSGSRGSN